MHEFYLQNMIYIYNWWKDDRDGRKPRKKKIEQKENQFGYLPIPLLLKEDLLFFGIRGDRKQAGHSLAGKRD